MNEKAEFCDQNAWGTFLITPHNAVIWNFGNDSFTIPGFASEEAAYNFIFQIETILYELVANLRVRKSY